MMVACGWTTEVVLLTISVTLTEGVSGKSEASPAFGFSYLAEF